MARQGKGAVEMSSHGAGLYDNPSSSVADLKQSIVDDLQGRRLSVSEFDEVDFNYEGVNSPGASSTSSEPVYIRQPGFDHHAHEVRANIPIHRQMLPGVSQLPSNSDGNKTPVTLRSNFFPSPPSTPLTLQSPQPVFLSTLGIKKETVRDGKYKTEKHSPPGCSFRKGAKKKKSTSETTDTVRPKHKKDPLPMKLRALPRSFWLQPNKNHHFPPSCSTLPPLILGKEIIDLADVRPVTPPADKRDGPRLERKSERIIKVGNTDLLFKLFDTVEKDDKKRPQVVRKGRPKKTSLPMRKKREDDPCLISTATDYILPLLPDRTPGSSGSSTPLGIIQAQGHQVLEFVNLRECDRTISLPSLSVEHANYSQILSELVLQL